MPMQHKRPNKQPTRFETPQNRRPVQPRKTVNHHHPCPVVSATKSLRQIAAWNKHGNNWLMRKPNSKAVNQNNNLQSKDSPTNNLVNRDSKDNRDNNSLANRDNKASRGNKVSHKRRSNSRRKTCSRRPMHWHRRQSNCSSRDKQGSRVDRIRSRRARIRRAHRPNRERAEKARERKQSSI